MGNFQYEWWAVEVKEATGKCILEVKARSKDNAIKQINKYATDHDKEVQPHRPNFKTEVLWETLELDRVGYQRLF